MGVCGEFCGQTRRGCALSNCLGLVVVSFVRQEHMSHRGKTKLGDCCFGYGFEVSC
jgi:hypothetical protein